MTLVTLVPFPVGARALRDDARASYAGTFDDYRLVVERYIEAGDRVIAFTRESGTAKASRVPVTAEFALVWTIRDGQIRAVGVAPTTGAVARASKGYASNISLLTLKRFGKPPETGEGLVADRARYRAFLPAVPASVARARHELAQFGEEHGGNPAQISIAVSEAVSNAVRHAYCGREAPVSIEAAVDERAVVVTVQDRGVGMTPHATPTRPGFGLPLIGSLADHVVVDSLGWGLTVQMRFTRH